MKTNDVKSDVNAHSKNTPQNVNIRRKKSVEDIYKALKPKAKEYRQPTDIAGLYCRVQPNGKKSWQYRYKNDQGKWAWIGLGAYPTVNYVQAREKAEGMLNGTLEIKTQAEIKKIKLQDKDALFSTLMNEWLERKKLTWKAETYRKENPEIARKRHSEGKKLNYLIQLNPDGSYVVEDRLEWMHPRVKKKEKRPGLIYAILYGLGPRQ